MLRAVVMNIGIVLAAIYVVVCGVLFFVQEHLIFYPQVLSTAYAFDFPGRHEEVWLTTKGGTRLNALYFTVPRPKGAILYLHGNGGSLRGWGREAQSLNAAGYDVLLPDYPGYGKSGGTLSGEAQLHETATLAYAYLKARYPETQLTVIGRSLGTGMATRVAALNHPRALILITPYFSLTEQALSRFPFIPPFIVKYPIPTRDWIGDVRCPVTLIHGTRDDVIAYSGSRKLLPLIRSTGKLVTIEGAGHNDLQDYDGYKAAMAEALP